MVSKTAEHPHTKGVGNNGKTADCNEPYANHTYTTKAASFFLLGHRAACGNTAEHRCQQECQHRGKGIAHTEGKHSNDRRCSGHKAGCATPIALHSEGCRRNDQDRDEHKRRPNVDAFPIVEAVENHTKQTEQIAKQHRTNARMISQQPKNRVSAQQVKHRCSDGERSKATIQLKPYAAVQTNDADDPTKQDHCNQCGQIDRFAHGVFSPKCPPSPAANFLFK